MGTQDGELFRAQALDSPPSCVSIFCSDSPFPPSPGSIRGTTSAQIIPDTTAAHAAMPPSTGRAPAALPGAAQRQTEADTVLCGEYLSTLRQVLDDSPQSTIRHCARRFPVFRPRPFFKPAPHSHQRSGAGLKNGFVASDKFQDTYLNFSTFRVMDCKALTSVVVSSTCRASASSAGRRSSCFSVRVGTGLALG